MTSRTILILLVATLALIGSAFADIVHLKSGGRIEGKATRTDTHVVVETLAGETKIRAGSVDRIDFDHESRIEQLYALQERADRNPHVAAYLEIAAWAQENGAGRFVKPSVERAAGRRYAKPPLADRRSKSCLDGKTKQPYLRTWRILPSWKSAT